MKRLANILITVTVLVLLTFCGGGIGVVKCACSGKVSFLLPDRQGCCPTEGGCMTVTTLQVSDSHLADGVDVPATMSFEFGVRCSVFGGAPFRLPTSDLRPADTTPPGISQSMVMRV